MKKIEPITLGTTTVNNLKGYSVEVLRGENDEQFSKVVDKINEIIDFLTPGNQGK